MCICTSMCNVCECVYGVCSLHKTISFSFSFSSVLYLKKSVRLNQYKRLPCLLCMQLCSIVSNNTARFDLVVENYCPILVTKNRSSYNLAVCFCDLINWRFNEGPAIDYWSRITYIPSLYTIFLPADHSTSLSNHRVMGTIPAPSSALYLWARYFI